MCEFFWREKLTHDIRIAGIDDENILSGFLKVPRERFSQIEYPPQVVYSDQVIVTMKDQDEYSTSSQPSLMAYFMKIAHLCRGMKVLEIGSGTGYNACVMAQIVKENGLIVAVEYNQKFLLYAEKTARELGINNVIFVNDDGASGCEKYAPYDAIIVTVAADNIPYTWIKQLKPGGRIVLPIDIYVIDSQPAFVLEKIEDGIKGDYLFETRFLKARGSLGNLNQRNLEKLLSFEKLSYSQQNTVIYTNIQFLKLLHLSFWSLCMRSREICHIEENGYAVWNSWNGKWDIFGIIQKLFRLFDEWKSTNQSSLREIQIIYDLNMNFLRLKKRGN